MTVSRKDTEYVANLARLGLSEEEKALFTGQLNDILSYIDIINSADTASISPTAHTYGAGGTRLREDAVRPSEGSDLILGNAPVKEDNMFRVPKSWPRRNDATF